MKFTLCPLCGHIHTPGAPCSQRKPKGPPEVFRPVQPPQPLRPLRKDEPEPKL